MADPRRLRRAAADDAGGGHAARRGHWIEVRINAENPAGGKFLPSPGPITKLVAPDGFGVRFDTGYESGDTISQYYDNLVGKLIVWGNDRDVGIARTIRALEEMVVEGVATTIPADLAILRHPDFVAVEHSTKWVEETLDLSGIDAAGRPRPSADEDAAPLVERSTTVEVNGKRFDVKMWVPEQVGRGGRRAPAAKKAKRGRVRRRVPAAPAPATSRRRCRARSSRCSSRSARPSRSVQAIVVLEAMKMENQINAEKAGTVKEIKVAAGDTVGGGDVVAVIE